jgi:hypothetical protein
VAGVDLLSSEGVFARYVSLLGIFVSLLAVVALGLEVRRDDRRVVQTDC